jgi:SAM-dependent MidA family methyltransferase
MISFCEYMNQMLYGPAGYYASGVAKSGKGGDYFTAPDVGSAMGQLLAEIFAGWQEKLGAPKFSVIEVGAGEGRLAEDILKSHPFHYVAIERSLARRKLLEKFQKQCPGFEIYPDVGALKSTPRQGVLFGNELIDAFPVHRIQVKGGKLRELFVAGSGENRRFVWQDPSTPMLEAYFHRLGMTLPDGYETEVNLAMADWLKEAGSALEKGLLVLIDYGRPAHEYYDPERSRGTLRAFSKHKVSADFLNPAGTVDLTADVDFTSLALDSRQAGFVPLAFMEMGTFLLQGLIRLDKRQEARGKGKETDSPLVAGRLSPVALKYLLHPEGLGAAFHVLILGKGIHPSDWVFEHNHLSRLGL